VSALLTRRVCVVGLVPHAPGEQLSTPIGDGGLRWLFDQNASGSIVRFWRDSTGGLVDLRSDVFGWFTAESAELVSAIQTSDRNRNAQAACDVALDAGVPIGSYDGLVMMIGGRAVGAGAAGVRVDDRLIPCAFLDDVGQHDFMCPEIGHVIGMDHSFRPSWTNPGLLYGEYGDAYDVMSARTYGGRGGDVRDAVRPAIGHFGQCGDVDGGRARRRGGDALAMAARLPCGAVLGRGGSPRPVDDGDARASGAPGTASGRAARAQRRRLVDGRVPPGHGLGSRAATEPERLLERARPSDPPDP
jgi:hypothetical protein